MATAFGAALSMAAGAFAQSSLRWQPESMSRVFDPGAGFYCYAPSAILDAGRLTIFACRNREPNVTRDHVYRLDVGAGGSPAPVLALGPDERGTWDSFHICDPSVVQGEFNYRGIAYSYAMFFLGNNIDAAGDNQVGVAFSTGLGGPWKRLDRPIVPDPQKGGWGTGQPAAVSIDHKGRVALFYTRASSGVGGYMREIDLAHADQPIVGAERILPTAGLVRPDGQSDWLNNFDVVRDVARGRYLIVREMHTPLGEEPKFISAGVEVAAITSDLTHAARWETLGRLTPAMTHWPRNHNPGFVRTPFGELPDSSSLTIVFSTSKAEPDLHGVFAPWSYQLHQISAAIVDAKAPATQAAASE